MEWFSWAVALILLISSVISPWLVAKENNKHQLSLKKLDIFETNKRNSLENFIKIATDTYLSTNLGSQINFYKGVNTLYIYFKDIPTDIYKLYTNRNSASYFNDLANIIQVLSKQIEKK